MAITPCRAKWKSTLTDRQRFNNQMHYRPVDRCFNMEFGYWKEVFNLWPIFIENGITHTGDANQFFNFDQFNGFGWGRTWMHPHFEEKLIEVRGNTKILQNSDGLLAEVPVDGHGTIPHYIKASIVTPDDWKKCKAERFRIDDTTRLIDVESLQRQHPADRNYPLGVYTGSMIGKIRDMLTFEGLAYACFDYPDMVEDMVETSCQMVEYQLDQVLGKIDFDFAFGWEDICFKNGPIVSLDFFTHVVVPRYKRIGQRLHKHGIDLWYTDCDGDVRSLIPGFLASGINCLFPFEVMGGGHPGELLKEFGTELRLLGGFDKTQMIKGKKEIKAYMETLVPWVERGGFIPFCDHLCPPDVAPENYLYYLDLKERMFGQCD